MNCTRFFRLFVAVAFVCGAALTCDSVRAASGCHAGVGCGSHSGGGGTRFGGSRDPFFVARLKVKVYSFWVPGVDSPQRKFKIRFFIDEVSGEFKDITLLNPSPDDEKANRAAIDAVRAASGRCGRAPEGISDLTITLDCKKKAKMLRSTARLEAQ